MSKGFDPEGAHPEAAQKAVTLLKALSHPDRLQILCYLLDGERHVAELTEALGTSQAAISQQLMRLRAEGLVEADRRGQRVIYRLVRGEVTPVIAALRDAFCRKPDQAPRPA